MSLKLYEIHADYEQLMDEARAYAAEHDGEIPPELDAAIEEVSATYEAKVINCGHMYKNITAEAEAIKAEEKRLADRRKGLEREAEWLKSYISREALPGVKYNYPTLAISWRSSKETIILNEAEIPEEFCRVKIEPNKTEIKKAILAGRTVPGAQVENKQTIQIK